MSHIPPAATVRTHLRVPLRFADGYATTARLFTFNGLVDGREHLALGLGDRAGDFAPDGHRGSAPLVRPHSECLTGDVFGSERCDCGAQMKPGRQTHRRRRWVPAVPAAGRARDRPVRQARRLRTAGRRTGHLRGEPGSRLRRRRARLHRCGPDAARVGRGQGGSADQQPGQGRTAQPARGVRDRPGADRCALVTGERALPRGEGPTRRTHARPAPSCRVADQRCRRCRTPIPA